LYDDVEEMQGRSAAARAKLGNIVFANSDTAWDAYAHSAMEEAVRAVGELLGAPPAEVRQPWYTRFLRRFSKSCRGAGVFGTPATVIPGLVPGIHPSACSGDCG